MYAVIKTGGKQYRVAAGDKIQIEKLEGNPGDQVNFAEVLMIAHCEAEGARIFAQQMATQQVMRSFRIGDRIAGYRNICKTETRESKDAKGTETKIRETICRDEPIVEPVYQQRLVSEWGDLNLPQRQSFVRACSAEAKAKGMFSHLK